MIFHLLVRTALSRLCGRNLHRLMPAPWALGSSNMFLRINVHRAMGEPENIVLRFGFVPAVYSIRDEAKMPPFIKVPMCSRYERARQLSWSYSCREGGFPALLQELVYCERMSRWSSTARRSVYYHSSVSRQSTWFQYILLFCQIISTLCWIE